MTDILLPVDGELLIEGEVAETYETGDLSVVKIYIKSGQLKIPISEEREVHLGDRVQVASKASFSGVEIQFADFPNDNENNYRR